MEERQKFNQELAKKLEASKKIHMQGKALCLEIGMLMFKH